MPAHDDLPPRRVAFGRRVRQLRLRESPRLSQEALAHRVGLDRSYVGQIERGEKNITLDNIFRVADALGVSPRDLF